LRPGQDISLRVGVRVWAQTQAHRAVVKDKARLRRGPGSGVSWPCRAGLWGAADQPCCRLAGAGADGPSGLKWGPGTWAGWGETRGSTQGQAVGCALRVLAIVTCSSPCVYSEECRCVCVSAQSLVTNQTSEVGL